MGGGTLYFDNVPINARSRLPVGVRLFGHRPPMLVCRAADNEMQTYELMGGLGASIGAKGADLVVFLRAVALLGFADTPSQTVKREDVLCGRASWTRLLEGLRGGRCLETIWALGEEEVIPILPHSAAPQPGHVRWADQYAEQHSETATHAVSFGGEAYPLLLGDALAHHVSNGLKHVDDIVNGPLTDGLDNAAVWGWRRAADDDWGNLVVVAKQAVDTKGFTPF